MNILSTRDDMGFGPPSNQRTRFYETKQLGEKQSMTPEGFLICRDVPIARTGLMVYARGELPLASTQDGLIYITRGPEELFSPRTIASFEGKAVTIGHPSVDVVASNWKEYAVGYVTNVRQGMGVLDDCLLADLVIQDADAINMVRSGRREVSNGYDAQYEQTTPGYGTQNSILGNHVAIVEAGRCGPTCRIGDEQMATTKTSSWLDGLRRAFMTRDADAFEKAVKEKPDEKEGSDNSGGDVPPKKADAASPPPAAPSGGDDAGSGGGGVVHHHIVVNVGAQAPAAGAAGADADPDIAAAAPAGGADATGAGTVAPGGDPSAAAANGGDPIAVIIDALTKLAARMDMLEQKVNGGGGQSTGGDGYGGQNQNDDDDNQGLTQDARIKLADVMKGEVKTGDDDLTTAGAATTEDGGDCVGKTSSVKPVKTGDATPPAKTVDAKALAELREEYQDTLARAEILVPGIRIPTFDAAADLKTSTDAICSFRRRVLDAALSLDKSRDALSDFYDGKTPIKTMTCDAVKVLFLGASSKMRDHNNTSQAHSTTDSKKAISSIAEMNKRNRELWKH